MKTIVACCAGLMLCSINAAVSASDTDECVFESLPERAGERIRTSGSVPHVQIGVAPVDTLNTRLTERVFSLPGIEKRRTVVSLPGATGMWLSEGVPVVFPEQIVAGREFAHIHTDGSLHAPLSLERALEIQAKGWGERHPWADRNAGWQGLVMLYSVSTEHELNVLVQLVTESYNHVTGQNTVVPGC